MQDNTQKWNHIIGTVRIHMHFVESAIFVKNKMLQQVIYFTCQLIMEMVNKGKTVMR
jgi:hypothetical protein